jgi:hypothetical protein
MTGRGAPAKINSLHRAEPPGFRAYFSINIVPLRVTDFLIRTLILVVTRQFLASQTLSSLASSLSLLAPLSLAQCEFPDPTALIVASCPG